MLRPLYRCVLGLHPLGFRKRFAEELLSIFDQAAGRLATFRLLLDGLRSLVRQWTLRPEFWHESSSVPVPRPVSDGTPSFYILDGFRPRTAAIIHGLVLSTAVFCLTCFAIRYSWIHVLHVRISEIQSEVREMSPSGRQSDAREERPIPGSQSNSQRVSENEASGAAKAGAPARPSSSPGAGVPPTSTLALTPLGSMGAQKNAAPQSAAPDSKLRKPTEASPGAKSLAATNLAGGDVGVPSAIAEASTLDAVERDRVIDGAVINLNKYYVYPEAAEKIANALRAHESNGDDNEASTGESFAKLLTTQMQDASHDQHLRVAYNAVRSTQGALGSTPEELAHYRAEMKRSNCTFEKAAILPHNLGYLRFNSFPDPTLCRHTAAAAMASLNQADAIIFDLRDNHGGSPSMVALMESYLFEHPTHLDDLYNRAEGTTLQYWTLSPVPGNRLANKPAYVLTSAGTFSGAEEFGYDLKLLKRATIVGETTAGAAHMVRRRRIDDHFSIGVPDTRPINPISKTDWEGTGVEPDVKVKAADALETAEKLAVGQQKKK